MTNQLQSLQGLHHRLGDIQTYLKKVLDGQLPVNHAILGNLQDVFNLLPNLSTKAASSTATANGSGATLGSGEADLAYAMSVKTNDQLMAIYLSSLIRAITAFHDLIENKIQNRQQQEEKDAAKKDAASGESSGPNGAAAAGEGAKKDDKGANGVSGDAKEGSDKEKK